MEGMLGTEHQNIPYLPANRTGVRISRKPKTRWRRGPFVTIHRDLRPENALLGLGGAQVIIHVTWKNEKPMSKIEQLKARKFTPLGKQERIARSLAVLQQPGAIQLSQDDWHWLDANFAIEDEFE